MGLTFMAGRIFAISWVVGLIGAMVWPVIQSRSQNDSSAAQSPSQSANGPPSIVLQVPDIVTHNTTFEALGRGNHVFLHEDLNAEFTENNLDGQENWLGRTPLLNEAWTALQAGNIQWEKGEKTDALAQWELVVKKYANTDAALAALWNMGSGYRAMGIADASIQAYKALLDFPDPALKEREVIPGYPNHKHHACLALSDMFLEAGDLGSALVYADLALDVHSSRVPDPGYSEHRENQLRHRIRSIQHLMD
jgi:tetratricopeptide (TPR) repeat protein